VTEKKSHLKSAGFTLVEVLVASTIGTFVALVAVSALRAITTSATMLDGNVEIAAEVRFASKIIQSDLVNIYRDKDQRNVKLIGMAGESGGGISSYMVFYTVSRAKARSDQPEGDVYEVEYFLTKDEFAEGEEGQKSALMRRLWPYPDEQELEPGGILTAIAENIEVFQVRFFDGQEWSDEWPEEMEALPQLLELNIVAKPSGRANPAMTSITVNLARSVAAAASLIGPEQQAESSQQRGAQGSGSESGTQGGPEGQVSR